MIIEAIILAGGLGTRLRNTVPDLPKCMAPVAGRPFLFYVINYLRSQGVEKFIFSLGYKHEIIEEYLADQFSTLQYQCSVEQEPLGTGGAIKLALQKTSEKNVLITNGDTLFKITVTQMEDAHQLQDADCTLALKPMTRFDRYGAVELAGNKQVKSFSEKKFHEKGLINGGFYLLRTDKFPAASFPEKFSFEQDYLERKKDGLFGYTEDGYFIDIGIPEDYDRAQVELSKPGLILSAIDNSWTIFIDRDGVINHEKKEDYIRNWTEFRFYDGATEALQKISKKFGKVVIVSNQRGVGKGLMTEDELRGIHQKMTSEIEKNGGRIDAIYYCTSTDNTHPQRKPNPGMAFRAKTDISTIDLSHSIIAGNKHSDMLFGRHAGLYTVFIASTNPHTAFPHPDIDLRFNSLSDFAKAL